MSRAFAKERDDDPEPRPVAEVPRVVTAAALRRMRERSSVAPAAERVALERRIAAARVAAMPDDPGEIAFGATVTVRSGRAKARAYTITDPADVDIENGRISEDSPLAQALLGRRAGEIVTWRRPAGDERLTIEALDYAERLP